MRKEKRKRARQGQNINTAKKMVKVEVKENMPMILFKYRELEV